MDPNVRFASNLCDENSEPTDVDGQTFALLDKPYPLPLEFTSAVGRTLQCHCQERRPSRGTECTRTEGCTVAILPLYFGHVKGVALSVTEAVDDMGS